jgi:hypothetical protein
VSIRCLSKATRAGRLFPVFVFLVLFGTLPIRPPAGAEPAFTVAAPEKAGTDGPVRLVVRFPSAPPGNDFYRIEIRIDGVSAELADVSRTDQTTVELPPLAPGPHRVTVVWRNPPDKRPLRETRTVTIEKSP